MKLTKIVCTIGPASQGKNTLKKLMKAGMNVTRLNFSHGTHAEHADLITNIRAAAKETGNEIALLQDLQGPRIRLGEMKAEQELKKGEEVHLVPQSQYNTSGGVTKIPNQYTKLSKEIKKGQRILIADGSIELKVQKIIGQKIITSVIVPGVVKSHKGINVPGAHISAPAFTAKDKKDALFGIKKKVDYIALSFVKDAKDIKKVRNFLIKHKASHINIIAKIERPEAVKNIDEIIDVVDGIMVARGDLALEAKAHKIPLIQKRIIQKCLTKAKPVIVATQMLESMTSNRRPTRAEVSDVATAIIDHTDAVMLSGESAVGKYPVEAVKLMSNIAHDVEPSQYDDYVCKEKHDSETIEARAHAITQAARTQEVACIIVKVRDEKFVHVLAAHRPDRPIIWLTSRSQQRTQSTLCKGVYAYAPQKNIKRFLKKNKYARRGQKIMVVTKGHMDTETI